MRTSFLFIAVAVFSSSCGQFQNLGKFIRSDQYGGRLYLDSDAIAAALLPLTQECTANADCKIGGIPSWDSCESKIAPNEDLGAYLSSKEAEFQAFKSDLKRAMDLLSAQSPRIICSATPDRAADPANTGAGALDPTISFYKGSNPAARCIKKQCVTEIQNTADFAQAVQVAVRRDRLGSQGSSRRATMAVVSGSVIRYGLGGFDISSIRDPQPNELFYGFSYSTNGNPSQDSAVIAGLTAAEAQPLLNAAASIKFCSGSGFSYLASRTAVPAIYCGSYSLGINGLYNDQAGYNWLRLCDSESVTAAKTVAQLLKGLIASKITNLPTEGIDALNDLGAWEPLTSAPQGLNCAL